MPMPYYLLMKRQQAALKRPFNRKGKQLENPELIIISMLIQLSNYVVEGKGFVVPPRLKVPSEVAGRLASFWY